MSRHQPLIVLMLIILAVTTRLWLHVPNMTAVGAVALFAGAYLTRRSWAVAVPLAALALSDIWLGGYEPWVMASVYGSFALVGVLGLVLRARRSPLAIAGAAVASSTLFFLITNFAVWATTPWYAKTFSGLMTSYTLGLPFFRNMLFGDLFFSAILFSLPVLVNYFVRVTSGRLISAK